MSKSKYWHELLVILFIYFEKNSTKSTQVTDVYMKVIPKYTHIINN